MSSPTWPQHQMPWHPGVIRANVFRLGRYLGAQGYTEAQIAAHLARHHGDVRSQERTRAAEFGERWGSRIRTFQATVPNGAPPRSWFLRNPNLPMAYRYTVNIQYLPAGGGPAQWNTILIDSPNALNLMQLRAEAASVYADLARRYARFAAMPFQRGAVVELLLAERRSG